MRNVKITNIKGNEIEIEFNLYYHNIETFEIKNKSLCGDMGFAFCEQKETRNCKTLKENIDGLKFWAENICNYEGIMNEGIEILYVWKGKFFDIIDASDYNSAYIDREKKLTMTDAKRIVREATQDYHEYNTTEIDMGNEVYALAICSPKVGKKLNLEEYVGMKLHYYDPSTISKAFADIEQNFLEAN